MINILLRLNTRKRELEIEAEKLSVIITETETKMVDMRREIDVLRLRIGSPERRLRIDL